MDQITALLEGIDFDAIMSWLTDLITKIDFTVVLDKIGQIVAQFLA